MRTFRNNTNIAGSGRKIFTPLVFAVLLFGLAGCQNAKEQKTETSKNNIVVVSHRGANRLAPECTYAAAQKSIE
ncbi:hypothetical protein, partial [Mariniphaga sediminis]|uniref:hypothetical protein n=1 Tax=Mariniphaga sediminis TaxID=1628158 RepID=UPI00356798C2